MTMTRPVAVIWGVALVLYLAGPDRTQEQLVGPDFPAAVARPYRGDGPVVSIDEAHRNFHATQLTFSAADDRLGDHPIVHGREPGETVRIVQSFTGQSPVGPQGSTQLLRLPEEAGEAPDRAALDAATAAAGRVVVLGEAAILSARIIRFGPASGRPDLQAGMNLPGNDNRRFAPNVAHWLSGLIGDPTSRPVADRARCTGPEQHGLDFWIGEWAVDWRQRNGRAGRAYNRVTRELDGCVIVERFRDRTSGLAGIGIYSYFPALGRWTGTWMDNRATTISAVGGPVADSPGTFVLTLRRGEDPNREYRFIFADIRPDRFIWRLQSRTSGEAWVDQTVSRYTRIRER
jgi:hypothetical protein